MRIKILLLSLFIAGMVQAQTVCDYPEGVNMKLIISEARFTSDAEAFIEITNIGDQPVRLSDYKFGRLDAWSVTHPIYDLCNDSWYSDRNDYMFLPDRMLDPGKSFVITFGYDYGPRHYQAGSGRLGGTERPKQVGIYEVADKLVHLPEPIDGIYYEGDSVTTALNDPENLRPRGDISRLFVQLPGGTMFLEHHYAEGDSAVIDQVGGVFDTSGRNYSKRYDVAGVVGAMGTSVLIRKGNVKNGNIDFANSRGISMEDSEWMPIEYPSGYNAWRDVFWTIGNHGSYLLDANTLEPTDNAITVDFPGKRIVVPWGVERLDDIMRHMKKKPGIAWRYDLNPNREDSLYRSARTGDKLTLYVAGASLQIDTFAIEVKEPSADDNRVVPMDYRTIRQPGLTGPLTTRTQNGILSWPRITRHESGVDTITGSGFGLTFDLRTDSLLKRLEKPVNATWEFVWVDGQARPDLKHGDILRVTSANGKVKDYFLQVQPYNPSTNADLASITWPDIPDYYRGFFGWKGDTIPNFGGGVIQYRVEVPIELDQVPALTAKTANVNARVNVVRAKSLTGTKADRTITFEVTAEDDTIHKSYYVELFREKLPDQIEPLVADPFISEFINSYPNGCTYVELFNPGNQSIDLRNYMISVGLHENAYYPISSTQTWARRYTNYIPGLKHVDQDTWAITPKIMMPDPNVNPIIPGGGTFVMAVIQFGNTKYKGIESYFPKWDVQFAPGMAEGINNPWNEHLTFVGSQGVPFPSNGNRRNFFALYKVLNDSIKLGQKAIGDVRDFQVIDIWGMPNSGYWVVGDYTLRTNETNNVFIRKPQISKGNPEWAGSFGTNDETSEWIRIQPTTEYSHISTPARYGAGTSNLNQHYMLALTYYKSTVNSSMYKVSEGFGPGQLIQGLKSGVTVSEFLAQINKEDENQSLKVISAADGSVLAMDAVLSMNDRLEVVSADGKNSTVYRLDVTAAGLSNNAYLSSTRWKVEVTAEPKASGNISAESGGIGEISGFDYGTTLKTIVDNVNVPAGATLTVVDGNGSYVPYTTLNFNASYVSVTVNPDIYFDVLAEDNLTRMVYQLQPSTSESDAFILSDVYEVSQMDNLIHFVPRNTNFDTFLANIIPSLGASLKLIDKMGYERKQGTIREDDKVVVTSANGQVIRVYFISFLPTSTILFTTYLAYVLSDAYLINQVDYTISAGLAPLTSETLVDEFMGYIIPSIGAAVDVYDKNGQLKTTGDLNDGDVLKVISADGKIVTTYTLALDLTATGRVKMEGRIAIFPNPAIDKLQVQGVEAGRRIQIFSAAGVLIREIEARSSLESISLEQVPPGLFLIVISNDQQVLAQFKAIRK